MSREDDISRRKVLSTTGATGSALIGIPAAAAGSPEDDANSTKIDESDVTREEVKEALDDMEVLPVPGSVESGSEVSSQSDDNSQHPGRGRGPDSGRGRQGGGRGPKRESEEDTQPSDVPDDVEIYVGKYKNAEPPAGEPFAVESYEEYLERDAPPGFENYAEESVEAMGSAMDFFYLKEDIGTVSIQGYTFDVGFGVGVRIYGTSALNLEATLSLDLYVGGASFSLSSFKVGYGVTDRGLCVGPINIDYGQIPGLKVEVCGEAAFTDVGSDELEVRFGPALDPCVDPCPVFTCAYCKTFSLNMSKSFPNPL